VTEGRKEGRKGRRVMKEAGGPWSSSLCDNEKGKGVEKETRVLQGRSGVMGGGGGTLPIGIGVWK
jgi:hypothetical protein